MSITVTYATNKINAGIDTDGKKEKNNGQLSPEKRKTFGVRYEKEFPEGAYIAGFQG